MHSKRHNENPNMFAPAYRNPPHQQTVKTQQRSIDSRKRKRGDDEVEAESLDSDNNDPLPEFLTTAFHPVNKTDPYYVAGHPRELPLPPAPFPFAAAQSRNLRPPARSIEEELAALKPPLYVPLSRSADGATTAMGPSSKRRHVDNLTTILHRCMQHGDWPRAYRAWSLLIRTEIGGLGIDVRRSGRWGISAELLMRGGADLQRSGQQVNRRTDLDGDVSSSTSDNDDNDDDNATKADTNPFSDSGFKLAREYYERLIIQHPYTRLSMRTFNATAIYPALFNIWVYEVQDRSTRARRALEDESEVDLDRFEDMNPELRSTNRALTIRTEELNSALAIAARMDELFMSPPYDMDKELRRLRGMVALWIVDLCNELSSTDSEADHRESVAYERERARELLNDEAVRTS